jgi:hypothetical protein
VVGTVFTDVLSRLETEKWAMPSLFIVRPCAQTGNQWHFALDILFRDPRRTSQSEKKYQGLVVLEIARVVPHSRIFDHDI